MTKETVFKSLVNIYSDFYDGLYTKQQLKFMINQVHKQTEMDIADFAELCLEAQWHEATEDDYEATREANRMGGH